MQFIYKLSLAIHLQYVLEACSTEEDLGDPVQIVLIFERSRFWNTWQKRAVIYWINKADWNFTQRKTHKSNIILKEMHILNARKFSSGLYSLFELNSPPFSSLATCSNQNITLPHCQTSLESMHIFNLAVMRAYEPLPTAQQKSGLCATIHISRWAQHDILCSCFRTLQSIA